MLQSFSFALALAWFVAPPDLTWESYETVCDAILPTAEEAAWLDVPWRSAFGEGLAEARAAGKPILLWAMNGHPLGCV